MFIGRKIQEAQMTKKHFEAMSWQVRRVRVCGDAEFADRLESEFIELAREFNPRFDAERFREACKIPA